MTLRSVATTTAPKAVGPYAQALESNGLLFCSGQIPIDPESGEIVKGGIAEQTDRVLRNLANVLVAGGSEMNYVLKTTVFLTDLSDFQAMNEVYTRHFGNHKPARSTLQVAALPKGALVEIDAIALVVK